MTYEKKLWVTGEKIEAHELNHIEDGLVGLDTAVQSLDAELDQSPSFEDLDNAVKDKADAQALESLKTEVAQKADQATTYTKTEVDNLIQSLVHYKGTVQTQAELPTKAKEGDFYFVVETSSFWGYSGTTWTNTEAFIDLSAYATKAEIEAEYAKIAQIPTALPNPEKMEFVFNGQIVGDYIGSEKKTISIEATLDTLPDVKSAIGANETAIQKMAGELSQKAEKSEIPDISGLASKIEVMEGLAEKQDRGDYALKNELPSLEGLVSEEALTEATKDFITKSEADDVYSVKPLIAQIPIRTLKDIVYTKDQILGWFGVADEIELKTKMTQQVGKFLHFNVTYSALPHIYTMPIQYIAFESQTQVKVVCVGLNTRDDSLCKYTIIMNLDGTLIDGSNSNVSIEIKSLEQL